MQTLIDWIDALPRRGRRPATGLAGDYGVRWWSHRELHAMAHRAARIFASHGIHQGQRILLQGPNSPEWAAFFLGAALRGIVVVPVDPQETTERLLDMARLTTAVFVVNERRDPLVGIPRHDLYDLHDVACDAGRASVRASDEAVILFTSGSTGAPRGVVLTHANLVQQIAPFLRFRAPLRLLPFRLLAVSPLSHVQGLMVGLLIPLGIGMSVLYSQSVEPRHLIRTIRAARIRFLNAVPRVLQLLESELRARIAEGGFRAMARVMGRRFRVILGGGAAMPEHREAFWRRSRVFVVQGYGLTETTALATINLPLVGRAGSIGFAMHRDSLRIATDGELLIRGPHVATRFVGDDRDALTDAGELCTGDLVRRDARNRFFFVGRKKETIVTAEGHNVHPAMLEAKLTAMPFVRDAVVLPLASEWLEQIHAVLLLDRGGDAGDAVQRTNQTLAPHERIRSWSVWPEPDFPRLVLGKPDRDAIAHNVRGGLSSPPSDDDLNSFDSDPRRRVDRFVRWFTARRDADVLATLQAQGVDSIEVLQVLTQLDAAPRVEVKPVVDTDGPSWPFAPGLGVVRAVVRVAVDPILAATVRIGVRGVENLAGIDGRCFFAIAGDDRLDRLDFLRVYRALPRRLRRRVMFLLASNPIFAAERPALGFWYDLYVQTTLRFAMPLFIPYWLFPKRNEAGTADALRRTCGWIDRGFTPLTTWGRGTAVMATECQLTVVPVRLRADDAGRVTVVFLPPIAPETTRGSDALHRLVHPEQNEGSLEHSPRSQQ